MKYTNVLATAALALALVGCGQTLDTSSTEKLNNSVLEMSTGMTPSEKAEFGGAIQTIIAHELSEALKGGFSAKNVAEAEKKANKKLHGMSHSDVIQEAERISKL